MQIFQIISIIIILFAIEIAYFKIASKYNIVDKPNHRSSHSRTTIRGGGVVFILAVQVYLIYFDFQYAYFTFGLLIIGLISFLDDLRPVGKKIRLTVHVLAVLLMFNQLNILDLPLLMILGLLILVIAAINAMNFMDGINGITGGYSLVTLATLLYINEQQLTFVKSDLLITLLSSVLVFGFFNFRIKAKCFAGDVGSVGIAFILVFFIGQLVMLSGKPEYIFFLLIYGLDATSTIIFRLVRNENILEAHRSHFYQFLANERKLPHLLVSMLYVIIQLSFNILLVLNKSLYFTLGAAIITTIVFVGIRFYLEGHKRLLTAIR